jgi:hypothetical protein
LNRAVAMTAAQLNNGTGRALGGQSAPQFGTPCGKGNEEKEMTDQQVVKDTNDLHHANKQVFIILVSLVCCADIN